MIQQVAKLRARAREIPTPSYASKLEAAWAQQLELMKRGGAIQHWAYEGLKIRLAGGAFYTPDFFVLSSAGLIELHECKGFQREAALVRIKVAAAQHPWFQFITVKKVKGRWESSEVQP